jgi:hypothetical protein
MRRATRHAVIVFATVFLLAPLAVLHAQTSVSQRPAKKLIEYGWDVPYPDQVSNKIAAPRQHQN